MRVAVATVMSLVAWAGVSCAQGAPAPAPANKPAAAAPSSTAELTIMERVQRYTALSREVGKAFAEGNYDKMADLCRQQVAVVGETAFDHGAANYNLASVLARLGRKDEALKALNMAVDQGFSDVDRIKGNKSLKSLQDDERFAQAIERAESGSHGENRNYPKPARKSLSGPVKGALRAVAFLDDNLGYAVGDGGLCQTTTDGGKTWRKLDTGSKAIYRAVLPIDKDTIYLCGDGDPNAPVAEAGHIFLQFPMPYSTVSYTRDGGKSWTNVPVPTSFMLTSLARVDDETLLLVTSGGEGHSDGDIIIFHIGGSWSDSKQSFKGGSAAYWAFGRKVVNGKSNLPPRGGRVLSAICRIDEKNYAIVGWPVGKGGTIVVGSDASPLSKVRDGRAIFSSDGGATWNAAPGSEGISPLRALASRNGLPLVAVGDNGALILLSHDKGATWSKVKSPAKVSLTGVAWSSADPPLALAVGEKGVIVASFDHGKTWRSATTDAFTTFTSVTPFRDGFAATTEQGKVVRLSRADVQRYFKTPAATTKEQKTPPAQPPEKKPGALGIALGDGAEIQAVLPDSGADKAGIKPGDAIASIDDRPIKELADLRDIMSTKSAGDKIRVAFVRDGKKQTVNVVLGASRAPAAQDETAQRMAKLSKELTKANEAKDYAKAAEIARQQVALSRGRDGGRSNYNLACALANLGRKDDALKALSLAVEQGFSNVERLRHSKNLDSLRDDERFAKVLDKAVKLSEKEAREKHAAELRKRFDKELGDKKYEAAAKTGRELLALVPDDVTMLYNFACVQARLKQSEEAIATLTKAVEQGWADPEQMKADDDLATLRDHPKFKDLLDKARKNERTAYAKSYQPGKEIAGVKIIEGFPEDGLRYRVRMSPDATAGKPNKLIIWLHPSAGQATGGMNAVVEAMSPMFLKHGYALAVFTQKNYSGWGDSDMKKLIVSLKEIGKIPGVDVKKPILLGFSAGGQVALGMWADHPGKFGGLIVDAAYPISMTPTGYDTRHLAPVPKDSAIKSVPILAVVGLKDNGSKMWKSAAPKWRAAGVPLEVIYVPEKVHQWLFDKPRTEQLEKWLTRLAAGELPGQQNEKADVPAK